MFGFFCRWNVVQSDFHVKSENADINRQCTVENTEHNHNFSVIFGFTLKYSILIKIIFCFLLAMLCGTLKGILRFRTDTLNH